LPVTTAAIEKNNDLCLDGRAEDNKIAIEFDTRRYDYHKLFNLD
jgi:hypothetical protein